MGHSQIDFSKYKGWEASVRGYIREHSLLVISLQPEMCSAEVEYILCDLCKQLPTRFHWRVDHLQAYQFEDRRWLLCDWKESVFVVCGFVRQREGFDLGRWLGSEAKLDSNEKTV